jgi:hypothetical protein
MQEDKVTEEYVDIDDLAEAQKGDWREKLAGFLSGRYFVPVVIILVAVIAFSLGKISGLQEKRPPVRVISNNSGPARLDGMSGGEGKGATIDNSPPTPRPNASGGQASLILREGSSAPSESGGQVVASKSGAKYHYPWCAGAKQISEKNKITFNSITEARAAGYTPATNCKGLK